MYTFEKDCYFDLPQISILKVSKHLMLSSSCLEPSIYHFEKHFQFRIAICWQIIFKLLRMLTTAPFCLRILLQYAGGALSQSKAGGTGNLLPYPRLIVAARLCTSWIEQS